MKRRLAAIQKVVNRRLQQVPGKGEWLALHEEWGVGRLIGGKLNLLPEDRDVMRQRSIQQYGVDPMSLDMEKDRTELSLLTSNEKLSRQRAFGRLLRVAVPGYGVSVTTEDSERLFLPTPPGVLLSVEPDQLLLEPARIFQILVIENAQIMERWWEVVPLLPETWRRNTLFAYRGHRHDHNSLLEWIKEHQQHLVLGFYGDFDAYGIQIGLQTYASLVPPDRFWLIGPKDVETIPRETNKPDTYAAHNSAVRYLERHTPPASGFRPLIDAIRIGSWAVTQEAMLAHEVVLAAYQE